MMITKLTSAPSVEPLTLTEVKLHLRLVTLAADAAAYTREDDLLNGLILAARTMAENYTHRALITQTWTAYLQDFPLRIKLPYPPFQSVTSITSEGAAFTDFKVGVAGVIEPADSYTWPSLSNAPGADPIVVIWKAGYGTAATNVPEPIRQAMKLMIGHLYANHEDTIPGVSLQVIPFGSEALLSPYIWIDFQ